MVVVLVVVLFIVVALAVMTPWRRGAIGVQDRDEQRLIAVTTEVLDLEAARDAKYREIRDAELDRETGHLSSEDFDAIDRTLRAEAVEILKQLDRVEGRLARLRAAAQESAAAAPATATGESTAAAVADTGESAAATGE